MTNQPSLSTAATGQDGWLEVGRIVAPQGIKGEVRVYPDSDFPERFELPGQRWLLRPGQREPEAFELLRGYYLQGKGLYVLQFAGVSDRDQAEQLRDSKILVSKADRPPLEEDEFHIADLVGLPVYDQETQEQVGWVESIIPAGNDLLEVKQAGGKGVLIPFVKAIVPVVDLQRRRIEITPPPGLVEL